MKTVVINAGPKRRDINAQLAKSAAEGAKSVGSQVEYVDLYKIDLSGCRACLICKNDEDVCKCFWRDELSPLIERIFDADSLLIAAPICLSQPTSHYMALLERLIFSLISYKAGNKFKGKVNVGLFYTVTSPMDYFEKSVRPHLKQSEDLLGLLNGEVVIESFSNISKNLKSDLSDDELNSKEDQLSLDLERVFEIAADLSG